MLLAYWKPILIVLLEFIIFFSGYHLRGLKEEVKTQREIIHQAARENESAGKYEDSLSIINNMYDNLNTKVTYENDYSCPIPPDGLRLLAEATR